MSGWVARSAVPVGCSAGGGAAGGAPPEDLAPRYCGGACRAARAAVDARTGPVLPALPEIVQVQSLTLHSALGDGAKCHSNHSDL